MLCTYNTGKPSDLGWPLVTLELTFRFVLSSKEDIPVDLVRQTGDLELTFKNFSFWRWLHKVSNPYNIGKPILYENAVSASRDLFLTTDKKNLVIEFMFCLSNLHKVQQTRSESDVVERILNWPFEFVASKDDSIHQVSCPYKNGKPFDLGWPCWPWTEIQKC